MIKHNPDILMCLANLSNDEVFTPPKIANEMLDLLPKKIWKNKNAKFLDPFTKTGVFLREIVKRLNEGLIEEISDPQKRLDHILKNQVYGIAVTELTAMTARRSLYCSKYATSKNSITTVFDNVEGNIYFEEVEHTFVAGKCKFCGAAKVDYDRGEEKSNYAYQFIHNKIPKEIEKMKFDVIIGNPPYQLNDEGHGASAKPIYHKFIQVAKMLNPDYISMIVPARWYSGGKGLDEFRNEMLNDDRLSHIVDYPNSKDCFDGVDVKGGIMYFLWDKNHTGNTMVSNFIGNNFSEFISRPLLEKNVDVFIRDNESVNLFKKIISKLNSDKFMDEIVSPRKPFGFESNFKDFSDKKISGYLEYIYFSSGKRKVGFVNPKIVKVGTEHINKWKVLIPNVAVGGWKEADKVLGKPFIAEPNTICSETYLLVGSYNDIETANNVISYINTKLFRYLVSLIKNTHHATRNVYRFVPLLPFDKKYNDAMLYKMFNLTKDEIAIIEKRILPMSDVEDVIDEGGEDE